MRKSMFRHEDLVSVLNKYPMYKYLTIPLNDVHVDMIAQYEQGKSDTLGVVIREDTLQVNLEYSMPRVTDKRSSNQVPLNRHPLSCFGLLMGAFANDGSVRMNRILPLRYDPHFSKWEVYNGPMLNAIKLMLKSMDEDEDKDVTHDPREKGDNDDPL